MALRFVLLGLVATLGFDLPSVEDLSCWAKSGQNWVDASWLDASRIQTKPSQTITAAADCERMDEPVEVAVACVTTSRDDLMFEAVVDGLAKDFLIDFALINEDGPVENPVAVVEVEVEVAPATARPETPEPVKVVETQPDPGKPTGPGLIPTSRIEKVSTAFRLTRQAMDAWASLIEPSRGSVVIDDQDDVF